MLIENEAIAHKRLSNLSCKLDKDPTLKAGYSNVFRELEQKGIIEEVSEDEAHNVPYPVFYLPHHPVVKESSTTTKIRPVFDASGQGCKWIVPRAPWWERLVKSVKVGLSKTIGGRSLSSFELVSPGPLVKGNIADVNQVVPPSEEINNVDEICTKL